MKTIMTAQCVCYSGGLTHVGSDRCLLSAVSWELVCSDCSMFGTDVVAQAGIVPVTNSFLHNLNTAVLLSKFPGFLRPKFLPTEPSNNFPSVSIPRVVSCASVLRVCWELVQRATFHTV